MVLARILLSTLTLTAICAVTCASHTSSLSGSHGERRTSYNHNYSCSCDDVTTDMCQTCFESGDFSNCCDFEACCDGIMNHGNDDKWGGAGEKKKWGGSSNGSWGGSSESKPKPKPKPHPKSKPKPKPKPKPHPKSKPKPKSKPSGGKWSSEGGWSNGGGWSSGGGWGEEISPAPTPSGGCLCSIFSDQSCAYCFEGTGTCPDKICAEECCQVKECVCDAYDSATCKVCLGNGSGSCPDADCAAACCAEYTPDGDSYSPKYGLSAGSISYQAKSMNVTGGVPSYMSFSIFVLLVGSAFAAIAYSSRRTTGNVEASEPLTRSYVERDDLESKGSFSGTPMGGSILGDTEHYRMAVVGTDEDKQNTQYRQTQPATDSIKHLDGLFGVPDISDATSILKADDVEEMISIHEDGVLLGALYEVGPSEIENDEIRIIRRSVTL